MTRIGLVYFSQTDITMALVKAFQDEAILHACDVVVHRIIANEIVGGRFTNQDIFARLHACQAIVFGSPTYMGSVAAQFKAFADATSDFWHEQKWAGKLAAGITSGTGLNGDQGFTLSYMQLLASQHGMLWVNMDAPYNDKQKGVNRLGCHSGVVAESFDGTVNETDLASARYLARLVVHYAQNFKAQT